MATNLGKLRKAIMAATASFKNTYLSEGEDTTVQFESYEGRLFRYALLWSLFQNNAYDNVHRWASAYKTNYAMYRYTRNIYNPAFRLGRFWSTHLVGGPLDIMAGDGVARPSAVPIYVPITNTKGTELRASISQLWLASNWALQKDLLGLYGPALGDVGIQITDDVETQRVYMEVVHPSMFKDVVLDSLGNVIKYEIAYGRPDPENPKKTVTYGEICILDKLTGIVEFTTTKDDKEYAWDGKPASWSESYGFVPMVFIRHIATGGTYGWAEIFPSLSKIREADDIASKLSDHIRNVTNPPWLFNFTKPKQRDKQQIPEPSSTPAKPQAGREEVPAIYASDPAARGQPLVADMNYQGVMLHLTEIVKQMEHEYPELRFDNLRMDGLISGEALRAARAPAAAKVKTQRVAYDQAMVKAHKMGIMISAMRGLEGFEGFSLESDLLKELDHDIATHSVFEADPFEELAIEKEFWTVANEAIKAGASLDGYLRSKGWDEERISLLGIEEPAEDTNQQQGTSEAGASETTPTEEENSPSQSSENAVE